MARFILPLALSVILVLSTAVAFAAGGDVPNGSFEDPNYTGIIATPTGWSVVAGTPTIAPQGAPNFGTQALRLNSGDSIRSSIFTVQEGFPLTMEIRIAKIACAPAANPPVNVTFNFTDGNGAPIPGSSVTVVLTPTTGGMTYDPFNLTIAVPVAPATAPQGHVGVKIDITNTSPPNNPVLVDGINIE